MNQNNNNVWTSAEELNNEAVFVESQQKEFFELPIVEALSQENEMASMAPNRRDFLKFLGFGLGAATVAACQTPIKKAIPYVFRPDELVPGNANYFASAYVNGGDFVPIIVKTREGRPIKIEGNAMSAITGGGTSARTQALVLSLYDKHRLKTAGKVKAGAIPDITPMSWDALDKAVKGGLSASAQVRIVTSTLLSPSTRRAIAEFTAKHSNTKLVQYDAVSASGLLDSNAASFGKRVVPNYKFDSAEVIVSFAADFLGTWISPVEYASQYAKNRKIAREAKEATMSRHYQFETGMSLTGSNADHRTPVRPSELGASVVALYAALGGAGASAKVSAKTQKAINAAAADLKAAAGKSLVVCGSNDTNIQIVVNAINNLLGNIGTTVDFGGFTNQRQGSDKAVQDLFKELQGGTVDALFVLDCNPVYDLPNGKAFGEAIKKAKLSVSLQGLLNETASLCQYVAPDHHNLEAWSDAEPKNGKLALIQPTISPLFETRQSGHSLLSWADSAALNAKAEQPYYEFVRSTWEKEFFGKQNKFAKFQAFWETSLQDGVSETEIAVSGAPFSGNAAEAAAKIAPMATNGLEASFFETVQMGAGQFATNPWLQEMSDPVSRQSWGNHISLPIDWDDSSKAFKGLNGLSDGDLVEVTMGAAKLTLPIVRQFGQAKNTISIALGYGRTQTGAHEAYHTGANAFPAMTAAGDNFDFYNTKVTLGAFIKKESDFACVQMHHTMGIQANGNKKENVDETTLGIGGYGFQGSLTKRTIINQTTLHELPKFAEELKERRAEYARLNSQTMYPDHAELYKAGVHWGMSIDLNGCIGCGACTVACMSENNVPVVGKFEVARVHEMSWIRIDRYYYGDVDSPNVVYQPMMCQHCDSAPCENVCPVNASNHSHDGLNQMTYNRCIGTRYCANNCPYKVRRFNWMDYTSADLWGWNENKLAKTTYFGGEESYMEDNITRMVLNPDVTVRTRGVIEKCSFCVQRIQEGKLTAKRDNRNLRDSDIRTACQTACPTGAIVFGNINNKETNVSKELSHELTYYALEEIGVIPGVGYRTKVANKNKSLEA